MSRMVRKVNAKKNNQALLPDDGYVYYVSFNYHVFIKHNSFAPQCRDGIYLLNAGPMVNVCDFASILTFLFKNNAQ